MKVFKWKIYCGSKFIEAGTMKGEDERDAMREVLILKGQMDADKSYSVTVGDTMMSAYGDEFGRSASVTGWGDKDEKENLDGGHLFQPKVEDVLNSEAVKEATERLTKVLEKNRSAMDKLGDAGIGASRAAKKLGAWGAPCQKFMDGKHRWVFHQNTPCNYDCACGQAKHEHDMNDTVVNPATQENHAKCRRCGFIDPQGLGQSPSGRGTDQIIGTALQEGKKGDVIYVRLDTGAHISAKCGGKILINERLRMGASGEVYLPAGQLRKGGIVDPNTPMFPLIPGDKWSLPGADPMKDIMDGAKAIRDAPAGIPYPDQCNYDKFKDAEITITNGKWTDPFTNVQAATIRKIVTLQGMNPLLIEGSLRVNFGWKFTLSNGQYIAISDQMISQFKG